MKAAKEPKPVVKEPEKKAKEIQEPKKPAAPKAPVNQEEAIQRAEEFLKKTLSAMGMEVTIKCSFDDEETLNIDLDGDDMGILIGKRGQTLDSVQYLTSLVVNKGKSSYVRVKVDTEDYRRRRKETLENLARNIASKVRRTRKTVFLEPMNPYERRIIHSALQNNPYVSTHSEGEEPYRKVVVTLKKQQDREQH
ncbi:MAG: RNA-binding cell elongation regulator Jag/EloR [Prevotella sp.]|nr:RNA-binding cell elongation regulator Jag/EloR [Prevotella sp.]